MALYFTSDFHLGDETLIHFGVRQFKSGTRMSEVLIKNANSRAKESDTIIHVGDFVAYGKDRGIESPRISGTEYKKKFLADVVLLEGNHDANNHVQTSGKFMVVDIGPYKNVTVSHYPSWYSQSKPFFIGKKHGIHLCGHVHSEWKVARSNGILNINIGVDVWNNQIVGIPDLIRLIEKELKSK